MWCYFIASTPSSLYTKRWRVGCCSISRIAYQHSHLART
ncbi:UNVERIFIED_CONTAM: hypothetical protein GTU68_019535 [Idotea baltica]|nr:hypothetical protein [Idotea baltica]